MWNLIDLTGQTFSRLTVFARAENSRLGVAQWEVKCSCGSLRVVAGTKLRNGKTKSCGCMRTERISVLGRNSTGHLHSLKHGRSGSLTYNSWRAMKDRCLNPDASHYSIYGGAGVTVCDRWRRDDGLSNFVADRYGRTSSRYYPRSFRRRRELRARQLQVDDVGGTGSQSSSR
jgi:hypothetical protein